MISTTNSIHVFELSAGISLKFRVETPFHKNGIMLLRSIGKETICCVPALIKESKILGNVFMRYLENEENDGMTCINAHRSKLSAIALDKEARLLATSSEDLDFIRVFFVKSGELNFQIKREFTAVPVSCLSFDSRRVWLVSNDDAGDVEIFYIKNANEKRQDMSLVKNRKSFFSFLRNIIPYFGSEWSFAKYRSLYDDSVTKTRFCGGKENNILKLNESGSVEILTFDKLYGGKCAFEKPPHNFLYNIEEGGF